jgi:hypothetical protein
VSKPTFNTLAYAVLVFAFGIGKTTVCQTFAEPDIRTKWSAEWISHPTAALREPGVFHFRKILSLPAAPERFLIHVSADNRFVLFVNGTRVGEGPARGNFFRWRYETFDLAPFLIRGDNVIAATVWQYGIYAPVAQISDRLAFLVEGHTRAEAMINTDTSWEVEQEHGHIVIPPLPEGMHQYWAAGPGERIDGTEYDWTWKEAGSSKNSHWMRAVGAIREMTDSHRSIPGYRLEDSGTKWLLSPDLLPPMEYKQVPSGSVVRTSVEDAKDFPARSVTILAHSSATILIDHATVLAAYPELEVSGGRGAVVRMAFTEALYDSRQERGNRSEISDRVVVGLTDEFLADGGEHRTFRPLWWRTWRYVELQIVTGTEPLTLEAFRNYYTAYPFEERGHFAASDADLARIREISWRTARIDAHETYMDTAYWEQLQYIGDTRIQALISYVVSGDDRLARQALQAFDDSRIPEGITESRYPDALAQYIPPFSLLYVNMLHDYWMYRPDRKFVSELLPGTRAVMEWFLAKQRPDGMLASIPGWVFIDWVRDVEKFPPEDKEGRSSIVTLQMVSALEAAADLEQALGDAVLAQRYRHHARVAAEAVYKLCWDPRLGLLADTPGKNSYSQHANIAAVLLDVIPKMNQPSVLRRILETRPYEPSDVAKLTKASLFYRFYMARALEHAGMAERYLDLLQPWREMLAKGLTTTPEFEDPTRSDTHAWSAHPAFDLATLVAGIRPGSPGFDTVQIKPALGALQWAEASVPHPRGGTITVKYERTKAGLTATLTLPTGLQGTLVWRNKSYPLRPGKQQLSLP